MWILENDTRKTFTSCILKSWNISERNVNKMAESSTSNRSLVLRKAVKSLYVNIYFQRFKQNSYFNKYRKFTDRRRVTHISQRKPTCFKIHARLILIRACLSVNWNKIMLTNAKIPGYVSEYKIWMNFWFNIWKS